MPSGDNMEAQNLSDNEQDAVAGQVMESLGEPSTNAQNPNEGAAEDNEGGEKSNDSLSIQKRLKRQKRAHEKEIRELHARIGDLQSMIPRQNNNDQAMNSYSGAEAPPGVDEQIHKAVSYALQHRDMQERKAKEAEGMAHVNRQYQELNNHLDMLADKYDDFDDVVRGNDAPFTGTMRDTALLLPKSGPGNAGEVLYKLGKNPTELKRIAQLHPLDQASEMVKLSNALISGGEIVPPEGKTLNPVKHNPATNSKGLNENSSAAEIRARMKAGKFK